jgi:hypothetical protein
MKVIETKDAKIKELNMKADQELSSGEVSASEISGKNVTRELELGKQKPVTANLAKRPEELETNGDTGEVSNRPLKVNTMQPSSDKVVEISVAKYVKCRIGKKWYEFKPNNNYRVNEVVKDILKRNGALGVL